MALLPAGSAERFVEVDGGRVRVLESTATPGRGRWPLLLIHGGGTDNAAISWYDVYAAFGDDRQVVGLDLPGFGGTEGIEPVGGAVELADFVARVVGRLEIGRAVVVGVSMGGEVALQVALRLPGAGRGPGADRSRWTGPALSQPGPPAVGLARRPAARPAARPAGAAGQHPGPGGAQGDGSRSSPTAAGGGRRVPPGGRRPGAGLGYARYNQASLGPWSMRNNLLPVVHRITAPTLFFHGEDDPLVDPEGSLRASRRMPDARLVLVPGVRPLGPARVPGPVPHRGPALPRPTAGRGGYPARSAILGRPCRPRPRPPSTCSRWGVPATRWTPRSWPAGWRWTGSAWSREPEAADAVLVNTCGFIEAAKKDSVDALLAAADLKDNGRTRAVVAVGCMAERYGAELAEAMPEADAVLGFDAYADVARTAAVGPRRGAARGPRAARSPPAAAAGPGRAADRGRHAGGARSRSGQRPTAAAPPARRTARPRR